ncbi:MAG: hypothetical protein ABII00_15165 [Elusimicrobiota bacterium]
MRHAVLAVCLLSVAAGARPPEPGQTDARAADAGGGLLEVPAGTLLSVELVDPVHTGKNSTGDVFRGRLLEGVWIRNRVVIPPGTTIRGELTQVVPSGRIRRRSKLDLTLRSLEIDGSSRTISTDTLSYVGDKHSGKNVGAWLGGALQGALYGVLFGGKGGAIIGAGAGAAAGGASTVIKGKQNIDFDQGARLLFETVEPFTVPSVPAPAPEKDAPPAKAPTDAQPAS